MHMFFSIVFSNKPHPEVVKDYRHRVDLLKGVLEAEKLVRKYSHSLNFNIEIVEIRKLRSQMLTRITPTVLISTVDSTSYPN